MLRSWAYWMYHDWAALDSLRRRVMAWVTVGRCNGACDSVDWAWVGWRLMLEFVTISSSVGSWVGV